MLEEVDDFEEDPLDEDDESEEVDEVDEPEELDESDDFDDSDDFEPSPESDPDWLSEPADKFRLFPDLKSVSYQPLPLSRKPAADTFLISAFSIHSGHSLSGSSLIFCKVSNSWPHLPQRYS